MKNIIVVVLKLLLIYGLINLNPMTLEQLISADHLEKEIISHFQWDSSEYRAVQEENGRNFHRKTVITFDKRIDLEEAKKFFVERGYELDDSTFDSVQQTYNKNTTFYSHQIYVRVDKIVIIPGGSQYDVVIFLLAAMVFFWMIWGWETYDNDKTLKPK